MNQKERRQSRRFLIQLPVTVRWTEAKVRGEATTKTRDVSSRGLRFDLPKNLSSGCPLEILMTLPHEVTCGGPVRVNCKARVVRTSASGSDTVEVVAAIQRFQFMRLAENGAENAAA